MTLTAIGAVDRADHRLGARVRDPREHSIDASIPPLAIVAALGASAVTGIMFGMLPAFRAARLDPVEALRYE